MVCSPVATSTPSATDDGTREDVAEHHDAPAGEPVGERTTDR